MVMISRWERKTEHMAPMGPMGNTRNKRILVGRPERKKAYGRIIHICKVNL
jgi:hypothetical protein